MELANFLTMLQEDEMVVFSMERVDRSTGGLPRLMARVKRKISNTHFREADVFFDVRALRAAEMFDTYGLEVALRRVREHAE